MSANFHHIASRLGGLVSLVLAVAVIGSDRVQADAVGDELLAMVNANVDSPWPDPQSTNNGTRAWGLSSYALAALYTNRDVATANDYIVELFTDFPIGSTPKPGNEDSNHAYFKLHLIWRIYLDPVMNARLTPQARSLIETNMWAWINERSQVADAEDTHWVYYDSENHDAMQKGGYLLCAEALMGVDGYGPNRVLSDGNTLARHAHAWTVYFLSYFSGRAQEGINIEVASPQYAKYTVGVYYNIRDYADTPELRTMAEKMITLYWADTASDWTTSGIRGGAEARCYKDGYLRQGTRYSFIDVLDAYGWHGNGGVGRTYALLLAASDYRVPDVITDFVTDATRPNHLYTSRRFGLHDRTVSLHKHYFDFISGNSHLLRESYVTADYTMGTMTFDQGRDYVNALDQNRAMGVFLATGLNDRVMIYGEGNGTTGFREISGVCRENCMVVQRDTNVDNRGDDTLVFISTTLWNSRVESGGWLFFESGSAYGAIRSSGGGYAAASDASGMVLTMNDAWAPVICQMGQASDYADFAAFQSSVLANSLTYVTNTMNYTSEAGDVFTLYAQSTTRPKINGSPVNLNPAKTYDSPLLSMVHGAIAATISHTGHADLVLDFTVPFIPFDGGGDGVGIFVMRSSESEDLETTDATHTISGFTVDAAAHVKLVLAASWEQGSDAISATWNGNEAYSMAVNSSGGRNSAILYLDDPTPGTADVVVTFGANTASRISVVSLTGAANGVSVTSSASGSSGSLDISSVDAMVVGVFTSNGSGTISGPFAASMHNGSSGSSVGDAGYDFPNATGNQSYVWTGSDLFHDNHALAEFLPVIDFAYWAASQALGAEDGISDDPDGDGLSNGIEAYLGTDPLVSTNGLIQLAVNGPDESVLVHSRSTNPPADLSLSYQWSLNLSDWYLANGVDGPSGGPLASAVLNHGTSSTTATISMSEEAPLLFLRILVTQ